MGTVRRFIASAIDIFTVTKDRVTAGYQFLKDVIDQVEKIRKDLFEDTGLFGQAIKMLQGIETDLGEVQKVTLSGVSMCMFMPCMCVFACHAIAVLPPVRSWKMR